MGAAGRSKVQARYRASAVVRQYEALWDELALAAAALDDGWRTAAPAASGRTSAGVPGGDRARPDRPGGDPAALSPASIFRAYPTGFLSPGDTIATVAGVPIDPPYSDVAVLLDRPLLEAIRDRCATPTLVGDVVAMAPVEARGWFAVMWLLKYGVLRVAGHGDPPARPA
jgi:hypothetical protein